MSEEKPKPDPHTATFQRFFMWVIGLGTLVFAGTMIYINASGGFNQQSIELAVSNDVDAR